MDVAKFLPLKDQKLKSKLNVGDDFEEWDNTLWWLFVFSYLSVSQIIRKSFPFLNLLLRYYGTEIPT